MDTIILASPWMLTINNAASSCGLPALVNRTTDQAYGPRDCVEIYPSWGRLPASLAVCRMMADVELDGDQRSFCERFSDVFFQPSS